MPLGLLASAVALVDGIWMIARRHPVACPDGKLFAADETDFTCYSHPLAHQGVAVVAFAVAVAVLVLLAGTLVRSVVEILEQRGPGDRPPAH